MALVMQVFLFDKYCNSHTFVLRTETCLFILASKTFVLRTETSLFILASKIGPINYSGLPIEMRLFDNREHIEILPFPQL
jgi:hypothetical protein